MFSEIKPQVTVELASPTEDHPTSDLDQMSTEDKEEFVRNANEALVTMRCEL